MVLWSVKPTQYYTMTCGHGKNNLSKLNFENAAQIITYIFTL